VATYSGTTAPAQFANRTSVNTYTGTTAPATYALKANPTFTGLIAAPNLKLTNVAAKTSETAIAYFKADGTILSGTSSGSGLAWSGATANGIGTYVSETCVKSNPKLTFDGSTLRINTVGGSGYGITVSASTGGGGGLFYGDSDDNSGTNIAIYGINKGTAGAQYFGGLFDAYSATAEAEGRSFGVVGCAGNRTAANNIGVLGVLCGTNCGVGVYGSVGNCAAIPAGCWAGVFCGNVYTCGIMCSTTCLCSPIVLGSTCVCGGVVCSSGLFDVGSCAIIGTNIVLTTGGARSIAFDTASTSIGSAFAVVGNTGVSCAAANACAGGAVCFVGGTGGNSAITGAGGAGGAVFICGGAGGTGSPNGATGGVCVVGALTTSTTICSTGAICSNTCIDANTCVVATTRFAGACVCVTACIYAATTICAGTCLIAVTCGTAPDWVATSDVRLKKDIEAISNALSTVTKLCGRCYHLCGDEKCEMNIGFIAQDVELVLPEIVSYGDPSEEDAKYGITDMKLGLKYDKLTAILVEAVKEQQLQIDCLNKEINILKNK
jgi:hypothetical protein